MSMTSRFSDSAEFTDACRKHGIYVPRCGLSVLFLLQRLRSGPISSGRSKAGTKMPYHASMGMAVKAGLVSYIREEKNFVISAAGETWLTELEIHGLVNTEPSTIDVERSTILKGGRL